MSGLKIERDARVFAGNQEIGRVTHVVVDRDTREVTEIVVAGHDGQERLIPVSAVADAGGGTVRLRGNEFVGGQTFQRDQFHGVDDERVDAENQGQAVRGGATLRDAQDNAVVIESVPGAAPLLQERIMRRQPVQPEPVQPTTRDEITVPVAEERLLVAKRAAELGEVRVHKSVVEEQQTIPVEVRREEVTVREVDIPDRPLDRTTAASAFEEGAIRVPVRGEEAIVQKEAVITGEVVIGKEQLVERQQVTDTVRREQVEVEESQPPTQGQSVRGSTSKRKRRS